MGTENKREWKDFNDDTRGEKTSDEQYSRRPKMPNGVTDKFFNIAVGRKDQKSGEKWKKCNYEARTKGCI